MSYVLGPKSRAKLEGVHPDLVAVIELAITLTPIDFAVIEGLRTRERQKELVAAGASTTMNSRHITGHAVDIAPYVGGSIRWDWPLFHKLIPAVKLAAKNLGVEIVCGADWVSFKDGPHIELARSKYP